MDQTYFFERLAAYDKAACVKMVKAALDEKTVSIPDLYTNYFVPALSTIASNDKEQEIPIWAEHLTSGIVRTLIEITYPYIENATDGAAHRPKAVVFCLAEEYHELGAKITADMLTLLGYDALFLGANTPSKEAVDAISVLSPDLVCISVSNYYHLAPLKKLLDALEPIKALIGFSTVVGGYAIDHTPQAKATLAADYFAHSFEDLAKIKAVKR